MTLLGFQTPAFSSAFHLLGLKSIGSPYLFKYRVEELHPTGRHITAERMRMYCTIRSWYANHNCVPWRRRIPKGSIPVGGSKSSNTGAKGNVKSEKEVQSQIIGEIRLVRVEKQRIACAIATETPYNAHLIGRVGGICEFARRTTTSGEPPLLETRKSNDTLAREVWQSTGRATTGIHGSISSDELSLVG